MNESEPEGSSRRISLDLPTQHINHIDQLRKEWGLRARGDVLKRILEEIFPDIILENQQNQFDLNYEVKKDEQVKLSAEKCGKDVIIKRKPRSIKDFLNGKNKENRSK